MYIIVYQKCTLYSYIFIVDLSLMYIVNVTFEKILYFRVKVNINVDTAFQRHNNWENLVCGVTGWGCTG